MQENVGRLINVYNHMHLLEKKRSSLCCQALLLRSLPVASSFLLSSSQAREKLRTFTQIIKVSFFCPHK